MDGALNNLVIVSDPHVGCEFGLIGPKGWKRDGGGVYLPSKIQRQLAKWWAEFWEEWVPFVTRGEPYAFVLNGDAIDGVHHRNVTQWSHNLEDQRRCAQSIFEPIVDKAAKFYHIRGTQAHVGPSSQDEEALARSLGAIPNGVGNHARYDLWLEIGGCLGHILHHISPTGSQAYEATAVIKELVEEFIEAAKWGEPPPDFIARAHRHRNIQVSIPTVRGPAHAVVTPSWQAKTPYVWQLAGARMSQPQWGGAVIRRSSKDEQLQVLNWVRVPSRSRTER